MKAYKEIIRKYYKYQYNDFVQPVLTSDGVIGGDRFAVTMSQVADAYYPYLAFDGKADTYLRTGYVQPQWVLMYNPNPLNISKIEYIHNDNNFWATSLDIQASVDGSNNSWITLLSLTGLKLQNYTWDINTKGKYYKYYRLYIKSASRTDTQYSPRPAQISELKLTAQEQTVVESSESDYDFYKDIDIYKLPTKIIEGTESDHDFYEDKIIYYGIGE